MFRYHPQKITVDQVKDDQDMACINGNWVPARPISAPSMLERIKMTVGVFTGKYDVFQCPEGQ